MLKNRQWSKKAFTLIELLIVIAIIGILGSIILAMIGSAAKRKAHDAKEITHISQIKKATESFFGTHGYYAPSETSHSNPLFTGCTRDYTGYFSVGDPEGDDNDNLCLDCISSTPNNFFRDSLVADGYTTTQKILEMFGTNPIDSELKICYHYTTDGLRYKIVSILNDSGKMTNDGGVNSNFYESGNDMSIPIFDHAHAYQ